MLRTPVNRQRRSGREKAPPAYDPLLQAFHGAFAPELRHLVDELPISPHARVLDLCCGDGFYAELLTQRLGAKGSLVAADLSQHYLARAQTRLSKSVCKASVAYVKADAYALAFPDCSFDLIWCAQSFISLTDPVRALAEMRRVIRPGGVVAILESDEFHHLLLPWPVELEMAVQQALAARFQERYGRDSKAAPARSLPRMMREAGLKRPRKRTYAADRQAPFSAAVKRFLRRHLRYLIGGTRRRLPERHRAALAAFSDPGNAGSVLCKPDAHLTCVNTLYLARR